MTRNDGGSAGTNRVMVTRLVTSKLATSTPLHHRLMLSMSANHYEFSFCTCTVNIGHSSLLALSGQIPRKIKFNVLLTTYEYILKDKERLGQTVQQWCVVVQ